MTNQLFESALGNRAKWYVQSVDFDTGKRRFNSSTRKKMGRWHIWTRRFTRTESAYDRYVIVRAFMPIVELERVAYADPPNHLLVV
jgi:hypothetical protein